MYVTTMQSLNSIGSILPEKYQFHINLLIVYTTVALKIEHCHQKWWCEHAKLHGYYHHAKFEIFCFGTS